MVFPAKIVRLVIGILALGAGALPGPCLALSCLQAELLFELRSGGGRSFRQPSDIEIHENRLYVLDDMNGRLLHFGLDGSFHAAVALPGGPQRAYLGFDFGGDDNLYLAAPEKGKIVVLNPKGRPLREFNTGADGISEPVAVLVSRGTVFVVDNEGHSVRSFDLEGEPILKWGGPEEGKAGFLYPFRIVQDSGGRLYVTDTMNSRVKVFTPKGEPLYEFGDFGVTEGTLYRPAGLAIWEESSLLVADNYLGSLQAFDLDGTYRAALCGADGRPLFFENPVSLAVRGSTLFVLEMGAGRVRALRIQSSRRPTQER